MFLAFSWIRLADQKMDNGKQMNAYDLTRHPFCVFVVLGTVLSVADSPWLWLVMKNWIMTMAMIFLGTASGRRYGGWER